MSDYMRWLIWQMFSGIHDLRFQFNFLPHVLTVVDLFNLPLFLSHSTPPVYGWSALRDRLSESLFKAIYENPWMKWFYPLDSADGLETEIQLEALRRQDADQWREAMDRGGFAEAVTRMILALMLADRDVARRAYQLAGRLFRTDARLKVIDPQRVKSVILSQARILQTDTDLAIASLPALLPTEEDRQQALALLRAAVRDGGRPLNPQEQVVCDRMGEVLGISTPALR